MRRDPPRLAAVLLVVAAVLLLPAAFDLTARLTLTILASLLL